MESLDLLVLLLMLLLSVVGVGLRGDAQPRGGGGDQWREEEEGVAAVGERGGEGETKENISH